MSSGGSGPSTAVIKVTFFVCNAKSNERTQLWLSLRLSNELTPHDVIAAATRHCVERLGGAKLDDQPDQMLLFLQSHGEFIEIEDRDKPLVSTAAVQELVHHEQRKLITAALVSVVEYERHNGPRQPKKHPNKADAINNRDGGPGNSESSGFQFRGRERAGSILPEALSHDPLADQRLRQLLPARDVAVTNDSFLDPPTNMAELTPKTGSVRVVLITPLERRLEVVVEYKLGDLCKDVLATAIVLLKKEAAKDPTKVLPEVENLLSTPDNLVLWYRKDDGALKKFSREEVLPVSRGLRQQMVTVHIGKDRGETAGSAGRNSANGAAPPPVMNVARRQRSGTISKVALRIASSTASLTGYSANVRDAHRDDDVDEDPMALLFLLTRDVPPNLQRRMKANCVKQWPLSRSLDGDETKLGGGPPSQLLTNLLEEECRKRLLVVHSQVEVQKLKRSIHDLENTLNALERNEAAKADATRAMEKTIIEGNSATRDINRLENLVEWFSRDLDSSKQRCADLVASIVEVDPQMDIYS